MRLINAEKGKLIVELTVADRNQISCLFAIIAGLEVPEWGLTENGEAEPEMNQEKFDQLFSQWNELTRGELANAYFVGK